MKEISKKVFRLSLLQEIYETDWKTEKGSKKVERNEEINLWQNNLL